MDPGKEEGEECPRNLPALPKEPEPRQSTSVIQFDPEDSEKDFGGKGTSCYNYSSRLANSELVSVSYETLCRSASCSSSDSRYIGFTPSTTGSSQTVSKTTSSCMSHIREIYKSKGIPQRTIPVLMNSWRASTKKQYDSHMKKWLDFLIRKSINISDSLTITVVLEFLTELFDRGYSYSTINSARSFLSSILPSINGLTVGSDPLIRRFMRGVFIDRPNLPRYTETWDVSIVLSWAIMKCYLYLT